MYKRNIFSAKISWSMVYRFRPKSLLYPYNTSSCSCSGYNCPSPLKKCLQSSLWGVLSCSHEGKWIQLKFHPPTFLLPCNDQPIIKKNYILNTSYNTKINLKYLPNSRPLCSEKANRPVNVLSTTCINSA